jgi:hypothetical protein
MSDLVAPANADSIATISHLHAFTGEWPKNGRLSGHTCRAYQRDVSQWIDWCDGRARRR